jgi:hypothetical protein
MDQATDLGTLFGAEKGYHAPVTSLGAQPLGMPTVMSTSFTVISPAFAWGRRRWRLLQQISKWWSQQRNLELYMNEFAKYKKPMPKWIHPHVGGLVALAFSGSLFTVDATRALVMRPLNWLMQSACHSKTPTKVPSAGLETIDVKIDPRIGTLPEMGHWWALKIDLRTEITP